MPEGHASLVPLGGLFLVIVGSTMIVGAPFPRSRQLSVWAGLGLGAIVVTFAAMNTSLAYAPTAIQIGSLAIAVIAEIAAFLLLMPKLHRRDERAIVAGTLGIVGAHFLPMTPAFGWQIAALGASCVMNAFIFWRSANYSVGLVKGVDGLLKLLFGTAMLLSP